MQATKLSSNMEDYLEAIFHVVEEKQAAKSRDISTRMKVRSSSVTGALRILSEHGLINYSPYDLITMTDEGRSIARDIIRRHEALSNFFIRLLDCDEKTAEEAACGMEHSLPPEMIEKLVNLVRFVEECPRCGNDWLEKFHQLCKKREKVENCEECMKSAIQKISNKKNQIRNTENKKGKN